LGWELSQYRAALQELCDAGLQRKDPNTSEILVERWFQHNRPATKLHRIGVRRMIEKIKSDELRHRAEDSLSAVLEPPSELQDPPGGKPFISLANTPHMVRGRS
jgi:hypothetical protein